MRLDFNILLIDDEIKKRTTQREFVALKEKINDKVIKKGFNPRFEELISIENIDIASRQYTPQRLDLVISDNNLGSKNSASGNDGNDGINFYLSLKDKLICDFVLYTKSSKKEVIKKLSNELLTKEDPNLFSRFTFTSKQSDNWHQPILDLIDHVLSKREEINNFRGLYAQLTARIDRMIQRKFNIKSKDFCGTLQKALENGLIDEELSQKLHRIRMIRNCLMHRDEKLCEEKNQYKIECFLEKNKTTNKLMTSDNFDRNVLKKEFFYIYENELNNFRDEIKSLHHIIQHKCLPIPKN